MKRKILILMAFISTLLMGAASVLAENGEEAAASNQMWYFISSAFGMATVSSIAALAMSISVKSFCEGVSRNPSAAGSLQTGLILTLVLIETLALYALAVIFVKVNLP